MSEAAPAPRRQLRGGVRPRPTKPAFTGQPPVPSEGSLEEADEVTELRSKYGSKLSIVKELFSDWSDEDLLFALQEANGDVEVASMRMIEGHTEQWGAVKGKKVKAAPSPAAPSARGHGGDRPVRGRGAFDATRGARGGRGVARGGRGGAAVTGRGVPNLAPATNGEAITNSATPASFVTPTPAVEEKAAPVAAPAPAPPVPSVPKHVAAGAWGRGKPGSAPKEAPKEPAPVATPAPAPVSSGGWGAPTQVNGGAETNGHAEPEEVKKEEAPVAEPVVEATPAPAPPVQTAPVVQEKPKSKVIAPGSKMSWAQIARPPSPPKPTPPPPAPVAAPAPVPVSAPIETPQEPTPAPPAPTITLPEPESVAEPVVELPAPAVSLPEPTPEPVASTGAGWNALSGSAWNKSPAALPVGEGWADAIAASQPQPQTTGSDALRSEEVAAHLPPNDTNAAGPIDVSPASAPSAPAAPTAPAAIESPADKSHGAGPPGLGKRAASRPQQEAVVLPANGVTDRIGVQFGSLSLFENEAPAANGDGALGGQKVEQQQQQPSHNYGHQDAATQHDIQLQYQQQFQAPSQVNHHQLDHTAHSAPQQEQGVQTSFSNVPQNLFPQQAQQSAFLNRYPNSYGQTQESDPQASAYSQFKPDSVSSPYFQQHSHSPAPGLNGSNASLGGYGAFGGLPQQGQPQQQQQQQQQQPTQNDYYSGQEAIRNMGFYDQYGQQQQQQAAQNSAFQSSSSLPRADDASASPAATPQPGQPGAPQQGQPPHGQAPAHHHYPGMQQMPYYGGYGYGYPQAYGQGYGQPNYNNLQQQFSQQAYGQYPAARGYQQPQYAPPQASAHSPLGGFQGRPAAGGQQGSYGAPQAQQSQFGGYGGYQQPQQGGERKDQQYASSKDLDRGFF